MSRDCGYADEELNNVIKQVCISGLQSEALRTKLFEWDNYELSTFEAFLDQASRYEAIEAVSNRFAAKDFVPAEQINVIKTGYQKAKQEQGFESMIQKNQDQAAVAAASPGRALTRPKNVLILLQAASRVVF